jgi:hypothetical protein
MTKLTRGVDVTVNELLLLFCILGIFTAGNFEQSWRVRKAANV